VYLLTESGELDHYKIGPQLRVDIAAVEPVLQEGQQRWISLELAARLDELLGWERP
jgi:hypothetical protein